MNLSPTGDLAIEKLKDYNRQRQNKKMTPKIKEFYARRRLYSMACSTCLLPIPVDTRDKLLTIIDEALHDLEALPFAKYLEKRSRRLQRYNPNNYEYINSQS